MKECRYARFCRFYQKDAHSCTDADEAEAYCGTFDVFTNFAPDRLGMSKKMLVK